MDRDIYPVAIAKARYGGVYEGAPWLAFYCYPEDIPEDASGDDVTCMEWWSENGGEVGLGQSPDAAVNDLEEITFQRLNEQLLGLCVEEVTITSKWSNKFLARVILAGENIVLEANWGASSTETIVSKDDEFFVASPDGKLEKVNIGDLEKWISWIGQHKEEQK